MPNNDTRSMKQRRTSIRKTEWNSTHLPLISLRVRLCIMQKNPIFEQNNLLINLIKRTLNRANLIIYNKPNVWHSEKWWLRNQKGFESSNILRDLWNHLQRRRPKKVKKNMSLLVFKVWRLQRMEILSLMRNTKQRSK